MITLDDLAGRATITVPEAAQLLGIGKDAAYAAAARGELPTLRLSRRLLVPCPKLLELLGATPTDTGVASGDVTTPGTAEHRPHQEAGARTHSTPGARPHGPTDPPSPANSSLRLVEDR